MIKFLKHTGKYRIRNTDGLYLVSPIDAWGKIEPTWERIPEASFRFSARQALEQVNLLQWDWGQKAYRTLSDKLSDKL